MSTGNGKPDVLGQPIYKPPSGNGLVSSIPTPWAMVCREHGRLYLTREGMDYCLEDDVFWTCPLCGRLARYDWRGHVAWARRRGPFKQRVYVPPGFEVRFYLPKEEM